VALLSRYGDKAKLIAGGTDLLVDMKNEKINPQYLISLMKITGLSYIAEEGDVLRIGATTTLRELEESQIIEKRYGLISKAVKCLGTVQIRNMATIGGNICNAVPSADLPPALVALNATLKIVGPNGERTMPLEDFFAGVKKTKLSVGELLKEIIVERPPARSGTAFIKLSRTAEDLAIVNVAVRITLNEDDTCREARIVIGGGVGPTLIRSREAEKLLLGKKMEEELVKRAAEVACTGFSCRPTSIRASPEYKAEVGRVLVKRALLEALKKAGGVVEDDERN
jgi:carbon-monoxide dehydrogenase medium subunit